MTDEMWVVVAALVLCAFIFGATYLMDRWGLY